VRGVVPILPRCLFARVATYGESEGKFRPESFIHVSMLSAVTVIRSKKLGRVGCEHQQEAKARALRPPQEAAHKTAA
jgi:hypothetical protein